MKTVNKQKIKWTTKKVDIKTITPAKYNPRRMTEKQRKDLEKSLDKFGTAEPIIVNTDGTIIGGHQRYNIIKTRGETSILVSMPERKLNFKEEKELNIRLNKNTGEFDLARLAEQEKEMLLEIGFSEKEVKKLFVDFDKDLIKSVKTILAICPKCGYEIVK